MYDSVKRLGIIEGIILIYVFFLPLEDFLLQGIVDSVTRIVAAVFIVSHLLLRRPLILKQYSVSYYVFFLWAILSIFLWAKVPDYYATFRLFMWLLTSIVIGSAICKAPVLLNLIPLAYLLGTVVLIFQSLFNFIGQGEKIQRVEVLGLDQNLLSLHLACGIVVSTYFFLSALSTKRKTALVMLLLAGILAVFSTGSRSGLLAVGLALIYFLGNFKRSKHTLVAFFLIFFMVINLVLSDNAFSQLVINRFSHAFETKTEGRLVIWKLAVNVISENPLFGVGYRSFPEIVKSYFYQSNLSRFELAWIGKKTRFGTHNAFFEVLAGLGVVGLTLFYHLQYLGLKKIKGAFKESRRLYTGFFIVLSTMSMFLDITNLKVFWLFIGTMQTIQYLNKTYS